MSKKPSFGRNAQLLCPECGTVQFVVDHAATVLLSCGHYRVDSLLPSNGIGLEHVIANTDEAKRLWPPSKEGRIDRTDRLMDEAEATAIREKWSFSNE